MLKLAKPLFSDVGMHYIANGNCAWAHGFRSFIHALLFPTAVTDSSGEGFLRIDLLATILEKVHAAYDGSKILVLGR